MRRLLPINLVLTSLLFAACVTINVYFPAAAAEKAADQIIDTVTGAPAAEKTAPPQGLLDDDRLDPSGAYDNVLLVAAGRVLELLVPAAHAQAAANLDISSPEIRAVTGSMTSRFEELRKYFESGALALTDDGLVEVKDASSVALAERATLKRLVAEDNRDRNTLYAEIAKANGHPEWEADIRKTFARRWIDRGRAAGWYKQ